MFSVKNTKLNKFILFESFVFCFFFLVSFLLVNNKALFYLGLIDLCFIYCICILKIVIYQDISIVELFLAYFFYM